MGHDLTTWWVGSQLDIEETRALVRAERYSHPPGGGLDSRCGVLDDPQPVEGFQRPRRPAARQGAPRWPTATSARAPRRAWTGRRRRTASISSGMPGPSKPADEDVWRFRVVPGVTAPRTRASGAPPGAPERGPPCRVHCGRAGAGGDGGGVLEHPAPDVGRRAVQLRRARGALGGPDPEHRAHVAGQDGGRSAARRLNPTIPTAVPLQPYEAYRTWATISAATRSSCAGSAPGVPGHRTQWPGGRGVPVARTRHLPVRGAIMRP